jgi:hypothetical protein
MSYAEFEEMGPLETAKLAKELGRIVEGERELRITLAKVQAGVSLQKGVGL